MLPRRSLVRVLIVYRFLAPSSVQGGIALVMVRRACDSGEMVIGFMKFPGQAIGTDSTATITTAIESSFICCIARERSGTGPARRDAASR